MLDDFFTRALLAGIGVAIVSGPLGCFIIWRRLAYYGDTLAHSGLLGVALAILLEINLLFSVFLVSCLVSLSLLRLQKRTGLSSDAVLGLLSHSALAFGLVILAFMTWVRIDLMGLLIGDILAVSAGDIGIIYAGGAVVLLVLSFVWRSLFVATVSYDLAEAEGMKPDRANVVFMILMATVIAISMKIVGVLLITALLIVPAAAARSFSRTPERMTFLAILFGVLSVIGGLLASVEFDTPSGPSIVVASFLLFLLSLSPLSKIVGKGAKKHS